MVEEFRQAYCYPLTLFLFLFFFVFAIRISCSENRTRIYQEITWKSFMVTNIKSTQGTVFPFGVGYTV